MHVPPVRAHGAVTILARNLTWNLARRSPLHHYTEYSVKSSPWKDRKGDVVCELAEAAHKAGIQLGVYLSLWDRHEVTYGKLYRNVMEVFEDSGKGEDSEDMQYFFENWLSLIHQLQPGLIIFSNYGPDIRWFGNEEGYASTTCWSLFNRSIAALGGGPDLKSVLEGGDPLGHDWVPPECDVSIRPGWFWHPSELPKSATFLLNLNYNSVGRNCPLLLNVPLNLSGLIYDEDVKLAVQEVVLTQFTSHLITEEGISTYWAPRKDQEHWEMYLDFHESINVVNEDDEWRELLKGTMVGYMRL
ncbi:alpha-L-fucosidase 1 [Tanacetum coccineum]